MTRFALPAALLLGLLFATGFAPLGLWPLSLVALAALHALIAAAPDLRAALARGYWFGVGHFVLGLNWIAGAFQYQDAMPIWLGWVAVLLLSLYLALYPALAAGMAWQLGRGDRRAFALSFAGSWVIGEWLRAGMFTGFAWNPIGVVALPLGSLAQTTAWIGSYGLSALLMLIGGGLWLLAQRRPIGALLAAPLLLALVPLGSAPPANGVALRIVQPNIGQENKHNPRFDAINFARLKAQTGKPRANPRLIFWPEAAIPDYIGEQDAEAREARARLADLLGPDDLLITGGVKLHTRRVVEKGYVSEITIAAANSVFVLDASGSLHGRYDKAHLVPYGEYLPMRPLLSAIGISRLVPGGLDFWPGPGAQSLDLPGVGKMGLQICYEMIFSGAVVDPANRPDFIFNPSNDAWFGAWGPPQHLAQARLRAIEEGLPVIRSTPTGISALIDANGRLLASIAYHRAGAIDAQLPRAHAPTLFARFGNALPIALALMLLGVALRIKRR